MSEVKTESVVLSGMYTRDAQIEIERVINEILRRLLKLEETER